MRLLLDQNLSPSLVDRLSSAGHDVVHVRALGMSAATDAQILGWAERDQRVVVSADTDFGEPLAVSNQSRPSVVLLRSGCSVRVRRQRSLLAGDQRSTRGSLITNDGRQIRTRDDVLAWVDAMAGDADGDAANRTSPA
ncbi:MAG: DUF5615 family PIN-like protein [Microthrixaceae bacterium]